MATPEALAAIRAAKNLHRWGTWATTRFIEKRNVPWHLFTLQDYKSTHGRYWKHNLKRDWLTGKDASRPNGHLLRQVRNQFGPKWLEKL